MKKLLKTLAIVATLTAIGSSAKAFSWSSSPNALGGYDYYGDLNFSTSPNALGGYDYFGDINGSSSPNALGGYDFFGF